MKHFLKFSIIILLLCSFCYPLKSQEFSIEKYKAFLKQTENLQPAGLYSIYPPGLYKSDKLNSASAQYFDSVVTKLKLTAYESNMLKNKSFMATERVKYGSVINFYSEMWLKDLPCFLPADVFLEGIHISYDKILKDLEEALLIGNLGKALQKLYDYYPVLRQKYSANPGFSAMLGDYDVYFTVALRLLNNSAIAPNNPDNAAIVDKIMGFIEKETPVDFELFSTKSRVIDFSQFTPRGHYTEKDVLKNYFKSMIWLGRTEFYLIAPTGVTHPEDKLNVKRQIIDAMLIVEAVAASGANTELNVNDDIIKNMVGESDNVQTGQLAELKTEAGIGNPAEILEDINFDRFQSTLRTKPYSGQKILSQIILTDPSKPDTCAPASAYMLLGQRFIIDSYIFCNVIYDKILYEGNKIGRLMPSSLDVLFALGNNAASDFLKDELAIYHYSANLSQMRYLVDSYNNSFWESSMYNGWLNMIRSLNPGDNASRAKLPGFMQTASWWQSRMNTQLASWAQLRHDNLLYAKQSYTPGYDTCSFPFMYVEPVPDFFKAMGKYASNSYNILSKYSGLTPYPFPFSEILNYFKRLAEISDTLGSVAAKELTGAQYSDGENRFINSFYRHDYMGGGCGGPELPDGWLINLFYSPMEEESSPHYVIADVHTQPTDEEGNPVGKILHVGTGAYDLACIIAPNKNGDNCTFVAPLLSYYECVTLDFKRLTDKEWTKQYISADKRPEFVDLYLADSLGEPRNKYGQAIMLPVEPNSVEQNILTPDFNVSAYPNPFVDKVYISFRVPISLVEVKFTFEVWDFSGKKIFDSNEQILASRNYIVGWDGKDNAGTNVPSGNYLYTLKFGSKTISGNIVLTR